jgi:hypothetical protein
VTDSGQSIIGRLQDLVAHIELELGEIGSVIDAYYKQHIVGDCVPTVLTIAYLS